MKIGAENRKKLYAAIGLMVLAVVVLLFSFGGSAPPPATTPTTLGPTATAAAPAAAPRPAATSRPAAGSKARAKKASPAPRSLDPTLRYDWLKASEDTKYEGTGRNIFLAQAEIPKPVAPADTDKEDEADKGPPPPPPPPPINLKFFGFASKPGEAKKIFLSEGEDVFIASEGEVVDRHYKVVRISPTSVEIEDVLNNNRQSIPLTAG
jgi:pyruvate/2-oxoglutarate dehydrogenase complex dihydrolipoamide acyltransferase (E2) component